MADRGDAAAPAVIVVAIDGPSGSGKSTVARGVAAALGLTYLESGALYRAVAWKALRAGVDPRDADAVARVLSTTRIELATATDGESRLLLDGEGIGDRLRTPEVTVAASQVARHPTVRERLTELLRRIVALTGGVVEGRDIGSVVFPETPYKFFLEADAEVRARRRLRDLGGGAAAGGYEEVLRSIRERDRRDRERAISPLTREGGYRVIDTSSRTPAEIVDEIVRRVRAD